jgi:hypothetical protein
MPVSPIGDRSVLVRLRPDDITGAEPIEFVSCPAGPALAWLLAEPHPKGLQMPLSAALLLCASAFATDASPSTLVPSAAPAEAGSAELGTGAMYAGYMFGDGGNDVGGVYLRGQVAITRRLSLGGSGTSTMSSTGFLPGISGQELSAGGTIAARYLVVQKEHINIAIYAGGGYLAGVQTSNSAQAWPMVMGGVAVEGGGKVRYDASLPFMYMPATTWGWQTTLGDLAVFSELGASFDAGSRDRLRFGKGLGYAADVKWTHRFGAWYTEAEIEAPVLTGIAVKAELGCTF